MPIGSAAVLGFDSLFGIAQETAYGTFVTATAQLEFESESISRNENIQKLNSIHGRRGLYRRIQGQIEVSGDINYNLHPNDGLYFIKNALAGSITTVNPATSTHTVHTLELGDWSTQTAPAALSLMKRVGSTTGRTWAISGARVNSLKISGAINEPIKAAVNIVAQNMTTSASSFGSISLSSVRPFLFFDGTYTSDGTTTALGTTLEDIVSFELTINNNIVSDTNARRIGSRLVRTLPPGQREIMLSIGQRFDTTSAFESYLAASQQSIRLHLDTQLTIGATAGNTTYSMRFDIRNIYIDEGASPVVGDNGIIIHNLNLGAITVGQNNTITSNEMQVVIFTSLATL